MYVRWKNMFLFLEANFFKVSLQNILNFLVLVLHAGNWNISIFLAFTCSLFFK